MKGQTHTRASSLKTLEVTVILSTITVLIAIGLLIAAPRIRTQSQLRQDMLVTWVSVVSFIAFLIAATSMASITMIGAGVIVAGYLGTACYIVRRGIRQEWQDLQVYFKRSKKS